MKLNFLNGVPGVAMKGATVDVKDRHAAELYVAHGDAEIAEGETKPSDWGGTLKREFPKRAEGSLSIEH